MAWQDNLRKASFRGIPFYYNSVASSVGRRTVVHKYPGRDDADTEDLGRDASEFTIEAWVIKTIGASGPLGDDYDVQRDRLKKAIETAGPGELVHPYWGTRRVSVKGMVRIRETPREGGMARLLIPVMEVGERRTPTRAVDTGAKVDVAADDTIAAAESAFIDDTPADVAGVGWNLENAIQDAVTNAKTSVNSAYTKLREIKGNINAGLNLVDDVLTGIQNAADELDDIIDTPADVVASMTGLAKRVLASVSTVESSIADLIALGQDENLPYSAGAASQRFRSQLLMAAFRSLDAFDADGQTTLGTGTQATAEDNAITAVIRATRVAGTAEAARAASVITFDSFDRAFSVLEELSTALIVLANTAADDVEYRTLIDLRAALALHIQTTAADLPRIVSYTPPETAPALVIAHRLYGDATRADEIIERNGIRNPAAVPGGVALEVLSRD